MSEPLDLSRWGGSSFDADPFASGGIVHLYPGGANTVDLYATGPNQWSLINYGNTPIDPELVKALSGYLGYTPQVSGLGSDLYTKLTTPDTGGGFLDKIGNAIDPFIGPLTPLSFALPGLSETLSGLTAASPGFADMIGASLPTTAGTAYSPLITAANTLGGTPAPPPAYPYPPAAPPVTTLGDPALGALADTGSAPVSSPLLTASYSPTGTMTGAPPPEAGSLGTASNPYSVGTQSVTAAAPQASTSLVPALAAGAGGMTLLDYLSGPSAPYNVNLSDPGLSLDQISQSVASGGNATVGSLSDPTLQGLLSAAGTGITPSLFGGIDPTKAFSAISQFLKDNPWALPAAGTLLGAVGASPKPAGTTTTVQDIPEWQKPYVFGLMNAAQKAFQGIDQSGGTALSQAAQNELMKTLSGGYLNNNPFLDATYNQAAKAVSDTYLSTTQPQTNALFYRAGAFGPSNSAFAEQTARNQFGLGQNLSNLATNIYGGNYNTERARQFAATAGTPEFLSSKYAAQFAPFSQYANIVGRGFGGTTTNPYFSNPLGGALSGALGGYALSKAFT